MAKDNVGAGAHIRGGSHGGGRGRGGSPREPSPYREIAASRKRLADFEKSFKALMDEAVQVGLLEERLQTGVEKATLSREQALKLLHEAEAKNPDRLKTGLEQAGEFVSLNTGRLAFGALVAGAAFIVGGAAVAGAGAGAAAAASGVTVSRAAAEKAMASDFYANAIQKASLAVQAGEVTQGRADLFLSLYAKQNGIPPSVVQSVTAAMRSGVPASEFEERAINALFGGGKAAAAASATNLGVGVGPLAAGSSLAGLGAATAYGQIPSSETSRFSASGASTAPTTGLLGFQQPSEVYVHPETSAAREKFYVRDLFLEREKYWKERLGPTAVDAARAKLVVSGLSFDKKQKAGKSRRK